MKINDDWENSKVVIGDSLFIIEEKNAFPLDDNFKPSKCFGDKRSLLKGKASIFPFTEEHNPTLPPNPTNSTTPSATPPISNTADKRSKREDGSMPATSRSELDTNYADSESLIDYEKKRSDEKQTRDRNYTFNEINHRQQFADANSIERKSSNILTKQHGEFVKMKIIILPTGGNFFKGIHQMQCKSF